ncbi:NF-kappa-B-repressing factor-like [Hetaerina americana]|uniref:NF-kappa-B-repressing factor-like n=1 Tax=Hetaerina americana TaxID=62018 RepID=UPI003A7F278D
MDNDWNVEDYKMSHETEDHWQLRKKFMLMHKDKFPEDKLVCLAQVFSNVEFMGCRYPAETMTLVADLSEGIVEEYRNSRKSKLKRTFVTASDAAGAKVKGGKKQRDSQSSSSNSQPSTQQNTTYDPPTVQNIQNNSMPPTVTYGPVISSVVQSQRNISSSDASSSSKPSSSSHTNKFGGGNYGGVRTYTIDRSTGRAKGPAEISDFVIVQDKRPNESQLGLLLRSSSASGFKTETKVTDRDRNFKCDVFINGKLYASAEGNTKKQSKEEAAKKTLDLLRPSCYTIVVKNMFLGDGEVEKSHFDSSKPQANAPTSQSSLLHKDNIGNKLLRLMGWSGGGLGANKQGIEEPVSVQEHVRRAGLGISSLESKPGAEFKAKAWTILRDFAHNVSGSCNKDLVFSSDFSREERAEIHQMAYRLNLKSRSYKKQDRQLVVSYKYTMKDIVAELRSCGGSNDKYELIPPGRNSAMTF